MVFGNDRQVTAKGMDFPSGWLLIFPTRGAQILLQISLLSRMIELLLGTN